MNKLILFLLFLPLILRAELDFSFDNEDPTLFHHINVVTGNLNLSMQDADIQGAAPLSLSRTYTSAGAFERQVKIRVLQQQ